MSIIANFYLNGSDSYIDELPCHCIGGGGGDGGAAARAEADEKARKKRIQGNISLIDLLFKNDPESFSGEQESLGTELSGLRPREVIPGFTDESGNVIPEKIIDPDAGRRTEIDARLRTLTTASGLLTGPNKAEREATTIRDVENFFFEDLGEQKTKAARTIRFELARRGTTRGSQEIDALAELRRKEDKGRLNIGNVAIDARNDLRVQDEQSRAALIDLANRDAERSILTSDFVSNLDAGLQRASGNAKLTRFDPFFEGAGNLFRDVELIRGDQLGRDRADRLVSFFSANPTRNFGTVRA